MADTPAASDKLAIARALVASVPLDVVTALEFLDDVGPTLGDEAGERVASARAAVETVDGSDARQQSAARYAIARIVVLLEKALMDDGA